MKLLLAILLTVPLWAESAKERALSADKQALLSENAKLTQTSIGQQRSIAVLLQQMNDLRVNMAKLQQQHGSDLGTIKVLKDAVPTLTPQTKKDIADGKEKLAHVDAVATTIASDAEAAKKSTAATNTVVTDALHTQRITVAATSIGVLMLLTAALIGAFVWYRRRNK